MAAALLLVLIVGLGLTVNTAKLKFSWPDEKIVALNVEQKYELSSIYLDKKHYLVIEAETKSGQRVKYGYKEDKATHEPELTRFKDDASDPAPETLMKTKSK